MAQRAGQLARRLTWVLAGLLGGSGCTASPPAQPSAFAVSQSQFESAEVEILVDVYTPTARTMRPPVLVLHGAGGMLFDGPEMTRVAQRLATAGFPAYQVHYFDRTHTWFARQAVLLKLFPTWLETVRDAARWVRTQRPEAAPVGIFGYSLGAFAAIETARRDPAIGAVVEEAGGFWQGQPQGPTRQPLSPILVIHGTADRRVPYAKYTAPLLDYLRVHDNPFEKRFYPGEGHDFSAPARAKVREEAAQFFQKHLPPRKPTPPGR